MTMPFNPYTVDPRLMAGLQMSAPTLMDQVNHLTPGGGGAGKLSLWDKIQNAVAPVPEGMGGLLGEQDIKNARNQGLLAAGASMLANSGPTTQPTNFAKIAGGGLQAGMQGYQGAIQQQLQNRQAQQQFNIEQMKGTAMKQQMDKLNQVSAARQQILQKYGPPPAGDPAKMNAWIDAVAPQLLAAGDTDSAQQLVEYRKALKDTNKYQAVQAGDAVYTFDPSTGTYTKGPERHMPADEIAMKKLQLAEQRARTEATQDAATESRNVRLAHQFRTDNKDIADRASVINQALLTVQQSQHDPALYKSAIANFVQAADQKAQLRSQMLQFFSNLDPSIGGKWSALRSRLLEGKLPAYQSGAMIRHLTALQALSKGEWDQRRAGEVKRHPGLDGEIPSGDELFNAPDISAGQNYYSPDALSGQYGNLQ